MKETLSFQEEKKARLEAEIQKYVQIHQAIDSYQLQLRQQKERVESTRANLAEELKMSEEAMQSELSTIQQNNQKCSLSKGSDV